MQLLWLHFYAFIRRIQSNFRAGMESIDGCLKNAYLPDLYVLQLCIYEHLYYCACIYVYMYI